MPNEQEVTVQMSGKLLCGLQSTTDAPHGLGLHYWYFLLLTCADILSCTGPSDAWREEYKRDIAQLDTNLRALINRPSIISTTTLQELGALANKKPKVGVPLPDTHALAWDSPIRSPASDSC